MVRKVKIPIKVYYFSALVIALTAYLFLCDKGFSATDFYDTIQEADSNAKSGELSSVNPDNQNDGSSRTGVETFSGTTAYAKAESEANSSHNEYVTAYNAYFNAISCGAGATAIKAALETLQKAYRSHLDALYSGNSDTDTETDTGTGTATNTQTLTGTDTATSTQTLTGTDTATSTQTLTGTDTATSTQTLTDTNTATGTLTLTSTDTGTGTGTDTGTGADTGTGTGTDTGTGTGTDTGTCPTTLEFTRENSCGPVTFTHGQHASENSCSTCHTSVFPKSRSSEQYQMSEMYSGYYCGKCHDGTTAFKCQGNCSKCHNQ